MCQNLTNLDCSNNNLAELPHYSLMQNISVLDCSFNLLKKLSLDMNKLGKLICNNNLLVALDLDNARSDFDGIIEPNYRTVSLSDDNKLDLSIFSDEDLDVIRMKDIAGGTLDGNTLTFNQESVSYKYQTVNDIENAGFSDRLKYMEVTLQADNFKTSGVNDIDSDNTNAPIEYFNLQGIRVDGKDLTPGFYILKHGAKVTKEYIKR